MKDKELLAEALKDIHPRETFEKALGRAVRRHNGNYEEYIRIMTAVRDVAYSKHISSIEAAKEIAAQP